MALQLGRTEIGIREFGTSVTVPRDPKAKLMFYLRCVTTVLDIRDEVPGRLTNYAAYNRLSDDDITELVAHCLLFSPDALKDKCFFEDNSRVGSCNKFLELSSVQSSMLMAGNIVIGGQNTRVAKVMTYTRSWMRMYYEEPMVSLVAAQLQQARRPAIQAPPAPRTSTTTSTNSRSRRCTVM